MQEPLWGLRLWSSALLLQGGLLSYVSPSDAKGPLTRAPIEENDFIFVSYAYICTYVGTHATSPEIPTEHKLLPQIIGTYVYNICIHNTHTSLAHLPPECLLALGHSNSEEGRHLELSHGLPLQLSVVLCGVLQSLGVELQGGVHPAGKLDTHVEDRSIR